MAWRGEAKSHFNLYIFCCQFLHQRAGNTVCLQREVDFLTVLPDGQAVEIAGHKVDVFFRQQRNARKAAHSVRAVWQQMTMPGSEIEKRIKTLVIVVIVILHVLRCASTVNHVFIIVSISGMGGKAHQQSTGYWR